MGTWVDKVSEVRTAKEGESVGLRGEGMEKGKSRRRIKRKGKERKGKQKIMNEESGREEK